MSTVETCRTKLRLNTQSVVDFDIKTDILAILPDTFLTGQNDVQYFLHSKSFGVNLTTRP